MGHNLSPEICEDELKTATRRLAIIRQARDVFIAVCITIVLIVLSFSFQVSENVIEECKSACNTTGTFMAEVTSAKCTCMNKPEEPE